MIDRLFRREETALDDVARQYSRLYKGIIRGVLSDEQDVEECANDVLLAVWNSIPPNRPRSLVAYLLHMAPRLLEYDSSIKSINQHKYDKSP